MKEYQYIQDDDGLSDDKENIIKMKVRVHTEPLSAKSQRKAEIELRETPERIKESCAELRKLLKKDEKMYFDHSEEFLMMFLRPTKYYPESAYKLMKRGADFKKNNSHLFKNLLPTFEKTAFTTTDVINVLTDRDQDGRRILYFRCGASWDPSKFTTDTLFRVLYIIHLTALLEPETQVNGGVIILDLSAMGLKQAKAFTPTFSHRLFTFIQDVMPVRLKQIHVVFQPYVFKIVWTMFKPFIREKLKNRIIFHGSNLASLHEYIDPDCLPLDYGGKKPKINYSSADWYPVLVSLEDKFKEMNSYGYVKKDRF